MKKITIFIVALLILGLGVYADVSVKDLGDGTAEVTFFYGNPRASEVVIAGSWTNWQDGAHDMTKTEKGWEYKVVVSHEEEMKYKFISDGNWTHDINAPEEVDDGFGGNNGLVDVAKLVAIEAAKESGDSSALEALMASAGLRFGTWTQLSFVSNFLTREHKDPTVKGFETDSVQLLAKSYWKLSGDILKNTPVFMELQVLESARDFYRVSPIGDVTVSAADGIENVATGLLFWPFDYLGGSRLGHFKVGVNTNYVNLETARFWAAPTKREGILWTTVNDGDANDGYLQITNGKAIQDLGAFKLDVGIVPNKSLGNLGLRSWLGADVTDVAKVDVQFDVKSTENDKVSKLFDNFEADIIGGIDFYMVDDLSVKAQFVAGFGSEEITDAFAVKAEAGYGMDIFGATAAFGLYQANAKMIYGDNDNLENGNSVINLNLWTKPVDGVKAGLDFGLKTTDEFKFDAKNEMDFNLYADLDLNALADLNMYTNLYAKMALDANADEDAFSFNELGLKFGMNEVSDFIPSFNVQYGLINGAKLANTVVATVNTAPGINAEVGFILRTLKGDDEDDANEVFGFSLGANYTVAALKNGVVYGAFAYNFDPYEADQNKLLMDGFRPEKLEELVGNAKFRFGIIWDF